VPIQIHPFYEPTVQTLTYVVFDEGSRDAVVIDPVLDYDPFAAQTSTAGLDRVIAFVRERGLTVHWSLETHPHADHLSGGRYLRRHLGAKVAIGARIVEVQAVFRDVYDLGDGFPVDGRQFDHLLGDGDVVEAGALRVEVIATPGHTPACVTYRAGDALFTGDLLFLHDYGTGRCDFPLGSGAALYDSVMRLYALPDATRVFPAHDYQPGGRPVAWETTIGRSKAENVQLRADTTRDEYVAFRHERDRTLSAPRLIWPSVQVNIDGGRLPGGAGRRFLRIPLNRRTPTDDDGSPRG
jgi:glyoxylase-like metal-dependent hydrolase (beta-lactamase superfamily II)